MMIHRGEAWLDAGHIRTSDVPARDERDRSALAINIEFDERPGIRPEEVLATAHAASYCLTLWNRLKQAGLKPHRVHTTAYVHHDAVVSPRAESEIFIDTDADIPGLDDEKFALHAKAAKTDFVALRGLSGIPVRLEPHLHA
jgi:osmotically inducible protein OsmC